MTSVLQLHELDNVAVALRALQVGDIVEFDGRELLAREDIPQGHKLAVERIEKGESVVKYGFPIGHATRTVLTGQHVHTHNLETNLGAAPEEYTYMQRLEAAAPATEIPTFRGYRRFDGSAGIRNELWIVPLVGCVNSVGEQIRNRFLQETQKLYADGVVLLRHEYGCSQLGDDHEKTKKILQRLAVHPNAGGVLVLSLGCENNTLEAFRDSLPAYDKNRVRFLKAQEAADERLEGVRLLKELNERMKADVRVDMPVSELRVGLKCGGSDGLSGITANPLIGSFTDFITACGGTAVLTEVPEMFGAETLLMDRAASGAVFKKIVGMIDSFKRYYTGCGQPVYENPSPGNKDGGITTLEEKSLGCTQKAGRAPVADVLDYGEALRVRGLSLLHAPGNDLVSATALTAAGCQLILFSTGRGTPFGTAVPTVKISSNSRLAEKKPGWIDFDAGRLISGVPMDELQAALVRFVLEIAGGRQTRAEANGSREIAIWKNGVTL
jgi:altronate hydrolase